MSAPTDELPTLDLTALAHVTGGAGSDMSSMLPMMMMMKNKSQAHAAPAPAATPAWTPKIMLDGVQQPVTSSANGTSFSTDAGSTSDPSDPSGANSF